MTSEDRSPSQRRSKKWIVVSGIALGVMAIAIGAFLVWNTVAENRRKARAEEAVHTALKQWCSDESLDKVEDTRSGDFFDEFVSRISMAPRPTFYQVSSISWVRGGAFSVYSVPVTLSFAGGPETRQYEVEVSKSRASASSRRRRRKTSAAQNPTLAPSCKPGSTIGWPARIWPTLRRTTRRPTRR